MAKKQDAKRRNLKKLEVLELLNDKKRRNKEVRKRRS